MRSAGPWAALSAAALWGPISEFRQPWLVGLALTRGFFSVFVRRYGCMVVDIYLGKPNALLIALSNLPRPR